VMADVRVAVAPVATAEASQVKHRRHHEMTPVSRREGHCQTSTRTAMGIAR